MTVKLKTQILGFSAEGRAMTLEQAVALALVPAEEMNDGKQS
jgi:hypothetical protein